MEDCQSWDVQQIKVLRISDHRVLSSKQDIFISTFKPQELCGREGGETVGVRDWKGTACFKHEQTSCTGPVGTQQRKTERE